MKPKRLRDFLSLLCREATLRRIVDPILGDMAVETERSSWRGYLDLLRALALHAMTSSASVTTDVISRNAHALPRALGWSLMMAALATLPFLTIPVLGVVRTAFAQPPPGIWPRTVATLGALILLGPQALVITLPPSLLIAGARVLPGIRRRTMVVTVAAVALLATIATGVLVASVIPATNQAYRVFTSGKEIPRGRGEYSLRELRAQAEQIKRVPPKHPAYAARFRLANAARYEYETRIALILSPLALAVLSMAIASTRAARRRPLLTGILAFCTYIAFILAWFDEGRSLAYAIVVDPAVLAWIPNVSVLGVALLLHLHTHHRRNPSSTGVP